MSSSALWRVQLIVTVLLLSTWWRVADSDGQTRVLGLGCSSNVARNTTEFGHSINATFSSLRTQLSENSTWFATSQTNSSSAEPVYALVQCRNYLSQADCLACYDNAASEIRNCFNSNVTGARLYLDGCFLRYEEYNFYAKTNENILSCEGVAAPGFSTDRQSVLNDSVVATPNTRGYFVATSRRLPASNTTIYVVAQCITTVTRAACQSCLTIAYEAMLTCEQTEGRLTDAACFMRYSVSPFFADNRTVDLTPYLPRGEKSSNSKAIIGGVAGGSGLVIILVSFILWYKFSRQLKAAMIGNLLGATKLQHPNVYNYEDLKEATNNFSEENKLGQGSFGIVVMTK